jgi:hypothetical protein
MTNWVWANEPRPGRLRASWHDDKLFFEDIEAKEQVVVGLDFPGLTFNGILALDGQHFVKGEGITARDVWHVITREHCTALRAGVTTHRHVFSSLPHEFEKHPVEGFEEVFLFLLPNGGKAVLEGDGLWPDGSPVNAVWLVHDKQLAQVPMGRHVVTALPRNDGIIPRVSYVWAYICDRPEWEKD